MTLRTFAALLGLTLMVALALAWAPRAFAAQSVDLRSDVALRDGRVTLGDLFEGAGAARGVIVGAGAGSSLVLDAARVQSVALSNGLLWDNPNGLRRVIARADASGASASAGAARRASVLAYGRDFAAGEVIQAEDLIWSKTLAFAPADAPRDSASVIGMAAKRPLRAGSAVSSRDVSAPQVIKKDDVVSVVYEMGGIRVVLQAKAMTAAAVGEAFNVINPGSKKVIQAVATGPGEAIVGPQADQLRAAMRANPQSLASLR